MATARKRRRYSYRRASTGSTAVALSAVLFVLEWVYLFHTGLAMRDEDIPDLISQLQAVDIENDAPAKEDE